ncbi:MAG: type II toxin-antitoxin system death-on-curing family toxin [Nanoarchaeota archaeon]
MINYPSVEDIITINQKVIKDTVAKKSDKHQILSRSKIEKVLVTVEGDKGDIYDKAIDLLKGLIQAHPFASGNRRTAFAVCQNFLLANGKESKVKEDFDVYILQGIREDYYTKEATKHWLKTGEIDEFKRR